MARTLNDKHSTASHKKRMLIACALVTLVSTPCLFALPAIEKDTLSPLLREYLEKEIGLSALEIESAIAARPVAKLIKTKTKDEVAIFGIVRIRAPQELFIAKLRDIVAFESGKGVHSIGRFQSPPVMSDIATLQFDSKELREIRNCRSGDCSIKLSDRTMQALQKQIDWSSTKAANQAQTAIRESFVDYVANYQKIGDEALAIYNDQDKPQVIRDSLRQLMEHSAHFIQYDPQLANYLEKYPEERPADAEDIFYWQKAEFGLKPVVRASHLVIHRNQRENDVTYSVASKMLYASHYFRAALELKSIVPDAASPAGTSFYLVCLNRSFVDGLTGIKGRLIRGTVTNRTRQSLANYLGGIKQKIEAAYRSAGPSPDGDGSARLVRVRLEFGLLKVVN